MPASSPDWSNFKDTKNRADILRYLQADDWEIKRDTFYRHIKEGKLTKNRNGLFTARGVKKYAQAWLIRTDTGETVGQADNALAARKTEEETKRITVDREHKEFNLSVARGQYLKRSDVDAELAARAIVLNNGLVHLFQSTVADMIGLVNGDQQRAADLIDFLTTNKDELLNEYATMKEFALVVDEEN